MAGSNIPDRFATCVPRSAMVLNQALVGRNRCQRARDRPTVSARKSRVSVRNARVTHAPGEPSQPAGQLTKRSPRWSPIGLGAAHKAHWPKTPAPSVDRTPTAALVVPSLARSHRPVQTDHQAPLPCHHDPSLTLVPWRSATTWRARSVRSKCIQRDGNEWRRLAAMRSGGAKHWPCPPPVRRCAAYLPELAHPGLAGESPFQNRGQPQAQRYALREA
jgi:hypothetical protein